MERDGFSLLPGLIGAPLLSDMSNTLADLVAAHGGQSCNLRGLLDRDGPVRSAAAGSTIKDRLKSLTGRDWFAVRALLFDKTEDSNWHVRWHQDRTIAVRDRHETACFSGWSIKEGVVHVQAPASVMEKMLAVRIHLDDATPDNGALQLLAGSHLRGCIQAEETEELRRSRPIVDCFVRTRDALLMRPLLLHGSPTAKKTVHRRVLHLEYSWAELPDGLSWHWKV